MWQRPFNESGFDWVTNDVMLSLGPTATTWREADTYDRVIMPRGYDYPTAFTDPTSRHQVTYAVSNDGFLTMTSGLLQQCTCMQGSFMACGGGICAPRPTAPITTGKAMSFTWDPRNQRTVSVWVEQRRDDGVGDREVRLSVGYIGDGLLPTSDGLGVYSLVTPGVACNPLVGTGYNCIVVYADAQAGWDSVNIRVRRFYATAGTRRFSIVLDPNIYNLFPANARTASRIAAWWHEGYYWVAIRPVNAGQILNVVRSVSGGSWTNMTPVGFPSIDVGPSAVSYWTGDNFIVYGIGF